MLQPIYQILKFLFKENINTDWHRERKHAYDRKLRNTEGEKSLWDSAGSDNPLVFWCMCLTLCLCTHNFKIGVIPEILFLTCFSLKAVSYISFFMSINADIFLWQIFDLQSSKNGRKGSIRAEACQQVGSINCHFIVSVWVDKQTCFWKPMSSHMKWYL